jgi:CspA family cold shock protein
MANWYGGVVQRDEGYGFIQPDQGGKDVFVHISAVERSGMRGLAEGMKVSYDVEADRRTGKESGHEFESGVSTTGSALRRAASTSPSKSTQLFWRVFWPANSEATNA